jgi:hypothetical protein
MKKKTYICGVTFFVKPTMYDDLKRVSDDLGIGMSDLLRGMIDDYLAKNAGVKAYDQPMNLNDDLTPKVEADTDGLL